MREEFYKNLSKLCIHSIGPETTRLIFESVCDKDKIMCDKSKILSDLDSDDKTADIQLCIKGP